MDDQHKVLSALLAVLARSSETEALPESVVADLPNRDAGIARQLAAGSKKQQTAPLLGIRGCQELGISTLADLMSRVLRDAHGVFVITRLPEVFYLSPAVRRVLAEAVHPLFAIRGVPNTHDPNRLTFTIKLLGQTSVSVAVSNFVEAADKCTEMVHWRQVSAPAQLIRLKDWCDGLPPRSENELRAPVRRIEAEHARERSWHSEAYRQASGGHTTLSAARDALLLLRAPDFDAGFEWPWQQAIRLSARLNNYHPETIRSTMTRTGVADFGLHSQRRTAEARTITAGQANTVLELKGDWSVKRLRMAGVAA